VFRYNGDVVNGRRWFLYTTAGFLAGCRKKRASGYPGYAFVSNYDGRAVAAVDLNIFAVTKHIAMDAAPGPILVHQARDVVYVLEPDAGLLAEIEPTSLAVRRKASAGAKALDMRFSGDGRHLWVLYREPRQLVRFSLDTLQRDGAIPLEGDPGSFEISPAGNLGAVCFASEGKVSLVDLGAMRAHAPRQLGAQVTKAIFRRDGKLLMVGVSHSPSIVVIDTTNGQLVVRLPLAVEPVNFCYKADGGQLFITGPGMDAVAVVYPYTTEVARTVLAGHAPGAMAECPAPGYLFVANPGSGDVSILDIETLRVAARASVGADPGAIVITPDNQYALVLNRRSGDMAVIRIPAVTARRSRSVALFTVIPVGSTPVGAAIRRL
jgi:YVTN family beta-propeller protein